MDEQRDQQEVERQQETPKGDALGEADQADEQKVHVAPADTSLTEDNSGLHKSSDEARGYAIGG
jgi:hypothetical protein